MNLRLIERIVNAVLYEGYILYPYRPSAVKNRQRFNFGALYPESYSSAQSGADASSMQTECLVLATPRTALDVHARFLHLVSREVARPISDSTEEEFQVVESLEVDGQLFQTWQEAIERDVSVKNVGLNDLLAEQRRLTFTFSSNREREHLRDASGKTAGVVIRKQEAIEGAIELAAERVVNNLFKLSARVINLTAMSDAESKGRDDALMKSCVSTHTILGLQDGEFVSLLDPPEEFRDAARSCKNVGTWPVLVGEEGERDSMLSSPIILYDYPQIAPESAGDLFDGTEIDEILTLRIMTLTDEEKRAMRGVDDRARQILERTESLPFEQFMKMHGAVRGLRPVEEDER
ncbi:MAG TPA: hypothetical protein VF131_09305 [Blastocatellia bacterium]|nr:hypothetical protein [Blastocatellia bacterium]